MQLNFEFLYLIYLLQVFTAIKENSMHIPYRNSKLTYLLQDSIGGDAKAMVFINISPLESNTRETTSTLMFGQVGITRLTMLCLYLSQVIRAIERTPAKKNTKKPQWFCQYISVNDSFHCLKNMLEFNILLLSGRYSLYWMRKCSHVLYSTVLYCTGWVVMYRIAL